VYAPVTGTVVEVNGALVDEPSLLNTSPYEEGWIAKIKLADEKEIDALMDEEAYKKHTE
jgi:glycine cleavage system H protein